MINRSRQGYIKGNRGGRNHGFGNNSHEAGSGIIFVNVCRVRRRKGGAYPDGGKEGIFGSSGKSDLSLYDSQFLFCRIFPKMSRGQTPVPDV